MTKFLQYLECSGKCRKTFICKVYTEVYILVLAFCFCYFYQKNFFFILGVVHNDPFFMQIGSKKTIFQRFYQLFSELLDFRAQVINIIIVSSKHTYFIGNWSKRVKWVWYLGQNMGKIRSNVMKKTKSKELVFQWVFFLFSMYTFTSKKVRVAMSTSVLILSANFLH